MTWKGESRRHSLSRKGIKTNLPDGRRFDVSNYVARGKIQNINWDHPDWEALKEELIMIENRIEFPDGELKVKDISKERKKINRQIGDEFIKMGYPKDWDIDQFIEDTQITYWVQSRFRDMFEDELGMQRFSDTPDLYTFLKEGG